MAVLFAERTATVPALPYGLLASVSSSRYTACHGVCATALDDSELALDAGITCDPDLARRAY